MSTTDGTTSGQLDDASRQVLESAPPKLPDRDVNPPSPPPARHGEVTPTVSTAVPSVDDWSVDGPDDQTYELPEIVPATDASAPGQVEARSREVHPDQSASTTRPDTTPMPTAPYRQPAPSTGWGDHVSALPANVKGAPLRAAGRKPRVRRVTRVLRHIDPWSTFKVSLLFSAVAYLVSLTSGVLLWRVADSTGALTNVERWFTQFGWETFELKGGEIFRNAWIIGLFGAVALTGALVLLATLFNLVSDIVGGVRMTVLEEEVVERTASSARRYMVRRPPTAATGSAADAQWHIDEDAAGDAPTEAKQPAPPAADDGVEGRATERSNSATDDWSIDGDDHESGSDRDESDSVAEAS